MRKRWCVLLRVLEWSQIFNETERVFGFVINKYSGLCHADRYNNLLLLCVLFSSLHLGQVRYTVRVQKMCSKCPRFKALWLRNFCLMNSKFSSTYCTSCDFFLWRSFIWRSTALSTVCGYLYKKSSIKKIPLWWFKSCGYGFCVLIAKRNLKEVVHCALDMNLIHGLSLLHTHTHIKYHNLSLHTHTHTHLHR